MATLAHGFDQVHAAPCRRARYGRLRVDEHGTPSVAAAGLETFGYQLEVLKSPR
jgi:hypothetical protein